jgi:secreted protein with Ig-like and vWFA domain
MGGAKAGPVRDKSPHWSRPYLGRQPFRDAQRRADIVQNNDRIATIGMEPAVKVNLTAPTVLGAGTNEIALVNQAKAATGRDVWVADVRSPSLRSRLLTARPL